MILKGPSILVVNLGLVTFLLRFLASSQTLSPMMNGVNLDWIQFFIVNLASSCAAEASSLALMSSFNCFSTVGRSVLLEILWSACGS